MALQKSTTTPHGFSAVDAYHRVECVRLDGKTEINFQLRSYKDATAPVAFADKAYTCVYDLDGLNVIAQAYYYLKTLPELAGALDC